MIIDVRFRPPYKGYLKLHVFARDPWDRRPGQLCVDPAPSLIKKSVPMCLDEMDRAGITKGMVIGRRAVPPFENVPNEDVLSFVHEYSGPFLCGARARADRPLCRARRARGVAD